MTSSYAHCRRWQEQPHQILFSQSLHHLVHIWARLYEGRGEAEEGSRGSPLSEREGGTTHNAATCVLSVHADADPGAVLVAAKKLSNAAVSLHLAVLFILQFQGLLFG